jgi:hypothetical protein
MICTIRFSNRRDGKAVSNYRGTKSGRQDTVRTFLGPFSYSFEIDDKRAAISARRSRPRTSKPAAPTTAIAMLPGSGTTLGAKANYRGKGALAKTDWLPGGVYL